MTIVDFVKDSFFNLPKFNNEKEDYKTFVFSQLDEFLNKLGSFKTLSDGFEDIDYSLGIIYSRQCHLVRNLKDALDYYYNGKPAKAYGCLNKGLSSNKIKDFSEVLNIRDFKSDTIFYRLRIAKENIPLGSNGFFHIPFEFRGRVKSQRFSIPGFPSLYLGTSIYVCWEELNRPNINDFQAVKLKSTSNLRIIDLSPPKEEFSQPYDYYNFLMVYPLILCSMVRVKEPENPFKPEYIIPQLLLQWVREKENIDGICYQTTHIDLSNSLSQGEFLNLVLPVKENSTTGLCSHLRSKFEMSEAVSLQLSQFSSGGGLFLYNDAEDGKLNKVVQKIELIKGLANPYSVSAFCQLERTLNYMTTSIIN